MEHFKTDIEQRLSWFKEKRRDFIELQDKVIADDKYSKEGKREMLNSTHNTLSEAFDEKRKELWDFVEKERSDLRRFAFSPNTDNPAKMQSYRDAVGRVADAKDKGRLLQDAIELQDFMLELAVLRWAYQNQKYDILNSYSGKRKPNINELFEFERYVDRPDFKMAVSVEASKPTLKKVT